MKKITPHQRRNRAKDNELKRLREKVIEQRADLRADERIIEILRGLVAIAIGGGKY